MNRGVSMTEENKYVCYVMLCYVMLCMYVYIHTCMYVCMYVCMYMFVYMLYTCIYILLDTSHSTHPL